MSINDQEKHALLRKTLGAIWERGHPYAEKMRETGVTPEDITSLGDLAKLPFTTKQELQKHYPLGWVNCDRDKLVRVHSTSGTTGNPTIVAYTQSDLDVWSDCMATCMAGAGLGRGDIIQISYSYGLFTGSFGFHYAAEKLGMMVVPAGGGFTERQIKLMADLGVTCFTCTPSYAVRLCEKWDLMPKGKSKLRIGMFGAEAWSEGLRSRVESTMGIVALNSYGLSEAQGPGVGLECIHKTGTHLADDAFLFEIVDPETLEPVSSGEKGELVITSLRKEAYPIIRYRTRDLTQFLTDPCPCGNTGTRIARIRGRTDDMIIVRGVNIFPSQIEAILCTIEGLSPDYQIQVWKQDGMQEMSVSCERTKDTSRLDAINLEQKGSSRLKIALGVNVPLRVLEPGELPRSEGKAKRVVTLPERNGNGNGQKN